ncbi:ABC transporter substrate-binding protein [Bacillota bacterium Meth-B3]|nr:ABC transporter substrate-binding protein [Christensenellaceae bacterium]MEA5069213.1 ABC transporter substrate-binding protein [Christensenellaceae bacterium]
MKRFLTALVALVLLMTSSLALAEDYAYMIGHYGGFTGAVATAGSNGRDAILLAIKLWNEKGGVLGGKIGIELYDDGSTTEGAVKGVSYLLDQVGVDGLIGSQLSGNIQATGDLVEAYQIPEVATGMNPAWLQKGWTYLFRALPNSAGGAAPLVDAMLELKSDKVASLVYQDDGNISAYTKVKEEIEGREGIEIIDEQQAMVGETDWTGALSAIVNAKPNGVIIFAQAEQGSLMVKQIRNLGYTGYIYGCETFSSSDMRRVAGEAANGLVFFAPHSVPDAPEEGNTEAEIAFLTEWVKEYGTMPISDVAYRAFDATNILLTAVEKAGTKEGPVVRDTIAGLEMDILAGHANFAAYDNGECMSGQQIFATHGGKNISWAKFLESGGSADTYK